MSGRNSKEAMQGKKTETAEMEKFARAFSELSEIDKKEIMNLIDFKRRYKESLNG